MKKHPIQPLELDSKGVERFKENKVVRFLLDRGPFDLNDIARMGFSEEDEEQLAQLIGYSLGGFSELSYVSDETYEAAQQMSVSKATTMNLTCPFCKKEAKIEEIGNQHTKKRSIKIRCNPCNVEMVQSILKGSYLLTFEQLKEKTIKRWRQSE